MPNLPELPYVERPEKADHPPMNELVCFLDKERGCGPDCMSFAVNTPGPEYNEPWGHCVYLSSLFRIGKHMVIMAQQGSERLAAAKVTAADAARISNAPFVPPFQPPVAKKVEP